jgi:sensor domain CHASE-containing protein
MFALKRRMTSPGVVDLSAGERLIGLVPVTVIVRYWGG